MLYDEVTIKEIESDEECIKAWETMVEEFPDHKNTNLLTFYEYLLIAKYNNEVIGVITGNKYLPQRAMLCDIIVVPQYRSQAVGMKLIKAFCEKVKADGFIYGTGITEKSNKEALNTYKKLAGKQHDMVETIAVLDETIAACTAKEQGMRHREAKRVKNVVR